MSTSTERDDISIARQLREAGDAVKGGAFGEALDAVAKLRQQMPKNIYCIGLEKQIQKLMLLPEGGEKQDVLSSIPTLVERAIDEAHRLRRAGVQKNAQKTSFPAGSRAVALERLITQYFGHAERYFRDGDYQKALVEIRRVHIIDPANRQAEEFEQKLLRLIEASDVEVAPVREENDATSSRRFEELLLKGEDSPTPDADEFLVEPYWDLPEVSEERHKESGTSRESVISIPVIAIVAAVAVFVVGYLLITIMQKPKPLPIKIPSMADIIAGDTTQTFPRTHQDEQKPVPGSTIGDTLRRSDAGNVITGPGTALADTAGARQILIPTVPQKPTPVNPLGGEADRREPAVSGDESTASVTPDHDTTGFAAYRALSESLHRSPKVDQLSEPTYPDSARKVGLAGQVIVFVQLDANGHPIEARIYKSSHPVFEAPARQAALRSVYSAGASREGPVPSWIVVPFLFRPNSPSFPGNG